MDAINVSVDNIYFLATGGGICFGGGEPLLRSSFIKEFINSCPKEWKFTLETSLNVNRHHLEEIAPLIDAYIIDIKDMNSEIYKAYTGKSNKQVKDNLSWLYQNAKNRENVIIRLPIIPDFNTNDDINRSQQELEAIGWQHFDRFEYIRGNHTQTGK